MAEVHYSVHLVQTMSRSGTISFSEHKERIMWINWPDINTSLTPAPQMGGPSKVLHTTLYHAGHALLLLRSDLIHFSQNFLIKRTIKSFQKLSNFQKCFDISQSIQRILKRIFLVLLSIEELEKIRKLYYNIQCISPTPGCCEGI